MSITTQERGLFGVSTRPLSGILTRPLSGVTTVPCGSCKRSPLGVYGPALQNALPHPLLGLGALGQQSSAAWSPEASWEAQGVTVFDEQEAAVATLGSKKLPLKQGSSGAEVQFVQKRLNVHGFSVSTDGNFGPKTAMAVKGFQSKWGLTADGVVGKKTWNALVLNPITLAQPGTDVSNIPEGKVAVAKTSPSGVKTITPIASVKLTGETKMAGLNWVVGGVSVVGIALGLMIMRSKGKEGPA